MDRYLWRASHPLRVHSKRQIKKLFKVSYKKFAEKRKALKAAGLWNQESKPSLPETKTLEQRMQELTYKPFYKPETTLANGWTPRPPQDVLPKDIPFQVTRTVKGGWLPVYSDRRYSQGKYYTIVRRIQGDTDVLQSELSTLCGAPVVKKQGRLELEGKHTTAIRNWLASIGF
uniref:Large ribosomal subunit protein mL49 n=1 Tax=Fibrocapsa japonica TaxID=94617 RepID=A0A7S2V0G5_9STRA|mmetsp:Transcript_18385/g.26706  ORF Transcript_18385/g.26706 Transcript_18385/m.26706 type:complete len:173 (+) Transcript_18385:75-593(+)|eukprot:CAMPEP_0113948238 /NCGR_PEP_ID=MMETSP1339-20121228/69329_1 /TAXON_ID=94617 /ORGANISM="Fibrocapsa japonica" /LENGTH=172 /DNA_ID=CAMNT_0000955213 /DNA_START=65 /DNA_END=583 /DNA_ORIENTATION=- /assembly_acc=CAM_ASM_000762